MIIGSMNVLGGNFLPRKERDVGKWRLLGVHSSGFYERPIQNQKIISRIAKHEKETRLLRVWNSGFYKFLRGYNNARPKHEHAKKFGTQQCGARSLQLQELLAHKAKDWRLEKCEQRMVDIVSKLITQTIKWCGTLKGLFVQTGLWRRNCRRVFTMKNA